MKSLLKSAATGIVCGAVAFVTTAWAIDSLLVWHEKWNLIPTDSDYAIAAAVGIWTCLVRSIFGGAIIGLTIFALTATYFHRRDTLRVAAKQSRTL